MDELIKKLSDQANVDPAKAADEVHRMIHDIVKKLKKGQPAHVAGLGTFKPGAAPTFQPIWETKNDKAKRPAERVRRARR